MSSAENYSMQTIHPRLVEAIPVLPNKMSGNSPPKFPSPLNDPRKYEEAIQSLKRNGLLQSSVILEALALISALPNHPTANAVLCSALSKVRTQEALQGRNIFALPTHGSLNGSISLNCYVNGNSLNPIGLSLFEALQNIIICGMQESGKSNTIHNIVLSNINNPLVRFFIFTKKKDERGFIKCGHPIFVLREGDPFNHLDSMGYPYARHAMTTASNFTFSTKLWLGPEAILSKVIERLTEKNNMPPTWREVKDYIQAIRSNDRSMREYLLSLDTKIGYLIQAFSESIQYRRGFDLKHAMGRHVLCELPLECPADIRRFHVLHIITWVFHFRRLWFSRLSKEEIETIPTLCFVIDDGHEIFCEEQEKAAHDALPPFYEIITGARAYKMFFIVATHTPEGLSKVLWSCHGTTIVLRLPSKRSRDRVREVL